VAGLAGFDDPAFFGERWADVYDVGPEPDPAPGVGFLAGLAGGGRVLELAIGTGRAALPLAARSVTVEGVEASEKMVARRWDRRPFGSGSASHISVYQPSEGGRDRQRRR
jgi:SAM-dependent methyltransferase